MTDIPTPWYMNEMHHPDHEEGDALAIGEHIIEALRLKRTVDGADKLLMSLIEGMLELGAGPDVMSTVRAQVREWNDEGMAQSENSWEPNEVRMLYLLSCAHSITSDALAEIFDFAREHVDAAQLADEQQ